MAISCGNCKAYCCRQMAKLFPEYDRGDGNCRYITEDNKCSIYSERPEVCNTDILYEKYFYIRYTPEEWQRLNSKACEDLHERYREEEVEVQGEPEMEEVQKGPEESTAG